ncbi:DUF1540 domain-containing protein [Thermaerobacter subterraneus]|uniref:DUF1540 domain-containing protein n=1 Tax=Thermaerobacter subterraneus DSM 13965 TaxID=867903 RepID=K6QC42_9FIRM|nr:DUF1540 domain-containing protein [Thermaerobacter subterraneus]EKP93996.1 protein of unknown function DUF1540 [Thermaerobacter subterraneus DSM 13965]
MLVGVRCTVADCHYWREGNYCDAEQILITHDWVSDRFPNRFDAAEIQELSSRVGGTPARQATDTCCKTFEPRRRS